MKKMFVFALAFVALASQAHAIEGKEKAEALKAKIAEKAKEEAGKANRVNPGVSDVMVKLNEARLTSTLSGNQSHDLDAAVKNDALIRAAAEDIAASHKSNPKLAALNKARLEGLTNLIKIPKDVRKLDVELALPAQKAQQAYVALVLSAGKEAAGWPEATRSNMVQFLEIANDAIRSGRSVEDAMEFAKTELKRIAKIDIKLEDIRRLCKKLA